MTSRAASNRGRRERMHLVIAPEFNGILETRCRWAVTPAQRIARPVPRSGRADGRQTRIAGRWKARGVPTPKTIPSATYCYVPCRRRMC